MARKHFTPEQIGAIRRPAVHVFGRATFVAIVALLWCAPGQAQTVKYDIEILGLNGELKRNAMAMSSLARARTNKGLPASEIERLHALAPLEIEAALQPFGYYRSTIRSELDRSSGRWKATYRVNPGPPIRVKRLDIQIHGEGAQDSILLELVTGFPLAEGDVLLQQEYEVGRDALVDRAAERGYLDAGFDTSEIRIDRSGLAAAVALHLNSGQRLLFGPITVHQSIVDTLLVVGYIPFQPGDTLDLNKLKQLQDNLTELPYFSRSEVDLNREEADGRLVPVDVRLTARKKQRFEVGAGYSTDTGIRGILEAQFRRLNRKGHSLTLRLDASTIERTLIAQYQIPPAFPGTGTWSVAGGADDFSPDWSTSMELFLRVNRGQSIWGGRGLIGLGIAGSAFEVAGVEDSSVLLMLSTDWLRMRTDNVMYPTRGLSGRVVARGSHESVLSTVSFVQVMADAKAAYAIAPSVRILARGEAGYTWTGNFEGLPPDIRFVTGGARMVRGYEFQSLGPRNDAGQILGGPAMLTGSIEIDVMPIKKWGRWGLAGFIDTGNALGSFRDANLEVSAGFGLRWLSPVGMLWLDWAHSLSQEDRPTIIHFSMGPYL